MAEFACPSAPSRRVDQRLGWFVMWMDGHGWWPELRLGLDGWCSGSGTTGVMVEQGDERSGRGGTFGKAVVHWLVGSWLVCDTHMQRRWVEKRFPLLVPCIGWLVVVLSARIRVCGFGGVVS